MAASATFAEYLREQLAPLGPITLRRMFGKSGVFCDGVMFAMVADDTLYLRVDAHNQSDFALEEAHPPLTYKKQGRTIGLALWRAPDRLFDAPDDLVIWGRAALAAAHRIASKRQQTAPMRKSKQSSP
jgi:DNA transformation protein and related proteins